MKKVYFLTPNLVFAFNENIEPVLPFMLENIVASHTDARFFYRSSFDVDFVLPNDEGQDIIEVKKSSKSVKQVKKYQRKFGDSVRKAMVVTLDEEDIVDGVSVVPAWKFLLGEGDVVTDTRWRYSLYEDSKDYMIFQLPIVVVLGHNTKRKT